MLYCAAKARPRKQKNGWDTYKLRIVDSNTLKSFFVFEKVEKLDRGRLNIDYVREDGVPIKAETIVGYSKTGFFAVPDYLAQSLFYMDSVKMRKGLHGDMVFELESTSLHKAESVLRYSIYNECYDIVELLAVASIMYPDKFKEEAFKGKIQMGYKGWMNRSVEVCCGSGLYSHVVKCLTYKKFRGGGIADLRRLFV